VVLTKHGQELLSVAQRTLAEMDGAMSRIGRSATESGRLLRVGAAPLVAANVLPRRPGNSVAIGPTFGFRCMTANQH
jgi:DNA-binding transcriptional LysR family regulator